jgi:hypothetical protein
MKWVFWRQQAQQEPEMQLYAEGPEDRFTRMRGALGRRDKHLLGEDTPEMDLYRQFRVASYLTAGMGEHFSDMSMGKALWEAFVKERPNGFTDPDRTAIKRLLEEKLPIQGKDKPYAAAAKHLDSYLKTANRPQGQA